MGRRQPQLVGQFFHRPVGAAGLQCVGRCAVLPHGVADDAQRIGLETDFVRADTFRHVLERVARGEVDVGLGPIAITEEREPKTLPYSQSG